jgi:hypothetical protein
MCYRSREVENGLTGHREQKHWRWTEDEKMTSRQVFGHGMMCNRSREVKNGFTGHWGQKHEGWTGDVKMASGQVFGHVIMCYRSLGVVVDAEVGAGLEGGAILVQLDSR